MKTNPTTNAAPDLPPIKSPREEIWEAIIESRGVESPCKKCSGLGVAGYSSTAAWRGGCGGAAMTSGVCDKCWGSGDANRPWLNLRTLPDPRMIERLKAEKGELVAALRGIYNYAARYVANYHEVMLGYGQRERAEMDRQIEAARAAIAKSEGAV